MTLYNELFFINSERHGMMQWQSKLDQLRRDERLPIGLSILFGLLILYVITTFVQTLMTHQHVTTEKVASIETAKLNNISALHLFGLYDTSLTNIPTAQLQLTLEGTVVFLDNPAQSRAVISQPNGPAKVYKVGDTLPGNATITHISKHEVVVNDNGTLAKLVLPIHLLKGTP